MTEAEQLKLKLEVVIPLVKESGKTVKLVKPNNGTFDDETGWTPGVPTEYIGYGITTDEKIEGVPTGITDKTLKTLLCVDIPTPSPNEDSLYLGTVEYKILHIVPIDPGNVTFGFFVFLGK